MESSDSQINKPQHGRPKRAELLDVIINTGAQICRIQPPLRLAHDTKKSRRILKHVIKPYDNRSLKCVS